VTKDDVSMTDVPPLKEEDDGVADQKASIDHERRASTTIPLLSKAQQPTQAPSPPISAVSSSGHDAHPEAGTSDPSTNHTGKRPSTQSATVSQDPWVTGGVPWYMCAFDPVGTTVHDPEQVRAASEPLSDMDEATLNELNPVEDTIEAPTEKPAVKAGAKRNKRASTVANGAASRRSRRRSSGKAVAGAEADDAAEGLGAERVDQEEEHAEVEVKDAESVKETPKPKTPRSSRRKTQSDEVKQVESAEKAKIAREKMDAYNAKRRAERKTKKAAAS